MPFCCQVLGHTRPEMDVLDVNNPSTGGVLLRHTSLPGSRYDAFPCPMDAITGYPKERQVDIHLLCDTSMAKDYIRVIRCGGYERLMWPQGGL